MLEAKTIEKSIVDWPSIYCVQQVELSQFKLIPHLTSPDTVVCIRGCDQIRVFFHVEQKKLLQPHVFVWNTPTQLTLSTVLCSNSC